MKTSTLCVALTLLAAPGVSAQHQHSPYAGVVTAEGTTLTPEEIQQLRSGEGMRLALPAELNRHPGPRHVLDLADELGLDEAQRIRIEEIFGAMRGEAVALGEEIIVAERDLTQAFRSGNATPDRVAASTARVAELKGRLQATHLVAHLATRASLSVSQIDLYDRLRGYH